MIMSRLNLGWTPQFPSYEEVYPSQWANNSQVEERHRQIMQRIQNWPYDENNEVRPVITSNRRESSDWAEIQPNICLSVARFNFNCSVWPEDVTLGLPDDPLQHGLRDPQEQGHNRKSSIKIQFTSSKIFEVNKDWSLISIILFLFLGQKCHKNWRTKSFWKLQCCSPSQGNSGRSTSCTWCEVWGEGKLTSNYLNLHSTIK